MPVRLESSLQRSVIKWAREHEWLALKIQTITNVGWPDVVFVPPPNAHTTWPIWLEFKREGEPVSPIQIHIQRLLAERHQRCYNVWHRETAIRTLTEHAYGH